MQVFMTELKKKKIESKTSVYFRWVETIQTVGHFQFARSPLIRMFHRKWFKILINHYLHR